MTSNTTARQRPRRASCWSTPLLAILLLAIAMPTLTSCAHGTPPTAAIPPELLTLLNPVQPVNADLTAPCPEQLPAAVDSSLPGLGRNHLVAAATYHDCKDSKARLAAAARDRERIESERIERARKVVESRER